MSEPAPAVEPSDSHPSEAPIGLLDPAGSGRRSGSVGPELVKLIFSHCHPLDVYRYVCPALCLQGQVLDFADHVIGNSGANAMGLGVHCSAA